MGEECILEWYTCADSAGSLHVLGSHDDMAGTEIGLWEEEELVGIDWDISTLPSIQSVNNPSCYVDWPLSLFDLLQ